MTLATVFTQPAQAANSRARLHLTVCFCSCGSIAAMITWGVSETRFEKQDIIFVIAFGREKRIFKIFFSSYSELSSDV